MDYPSRHELCRIIKEVSPIITDRKLAGDVHEKGADDFVTRADTSVQAYLKKRLSACFPNCRFMGEEDSDHSVISDIPTFILDPIDGTTNFIHDLHLSAVSLALVHNGEVVRAAIFNPYANEIFSAEKDGGAFLNDEKISVSNCPDLDHALVGIGTMPYRKKISEGFFELYRQLFIAATDIRRLGSSVIDGCCTAVGRLDCYVEGGLGAWDVAATSLLVKEAGGTVSDWSGAPFKLRTDSCENYIVYSNGKFHSSIIEYISKYIKK